MLVPSRMRHISSQQPLKLLEQHAQGHTDLTTREAPPPIGIHLESTTRLGRCRDYFHAQNVLSARLVQRLGAVGGIGTAPQYRREPHPDDQGANRQRAEQHERRGESERLGDDPAQHRAERTT